MKLLRTIVINYSGWAFFLLSLVVVALLLGRAYQRVGEVERDEILKETNLSLENGARIKFATNEPSGKPEILNSENYSVLSYNHADSALVVDGEEYYLWSQVHNYRVDRRNKQVFYTVSTNEDPLKRAFILEQTTKIVDQHTIANEYYMIWNTPENVSGEVKEVLLGLVHEGDNLSALGEEKGLIKGQSQVNARRAEAGSTSTVSYIPFEIKTENLVQTNLQKMDPESNSGFLTVYKLENPEKGKRNLIARETIKIGNPFP